MSRRLQKFKNFLLIDVFRFRGHFRTMLHSQCVYFKIELKMHHFKFWTWSRGISAQDNALTFVIDWHQINPEQRYFLWLLQEVPRFWRLILLFIFHFSNMTIELVCFSWLSILNWQKQETLHGCSWETNGHFVLGEKSYSASTRQIKHTHITSFDLLHFQSDAPLAFRQWMSGRHLHKWSPARTSFSTLFRSRTHFSQL